MNLNTLSVIGVILLLTFNPALAAIPTDVPPLSEKVEETTLDNGLKIVIVERHAAPVFFALQTFRVGSTIEITNRSGLSHFMEHMLFKGSETIGTKNYRKERPIMEELETVALEMRDLQTSMQNWRFQMFEDYTTTVKFDIPPEKKQEAGSDAAATWRMVLEALPESAADLPLEWRDSPWIATDADRNYWLDYRRILELRINISELLTEQREYIVQTEHDGIYDTHGGKNNNAFTSYDETGYTVGLPSNCLELWMFIESDRFMNPVFREFYSERDVILEEKSQREDNPGGALRKSFMEVAFSAHPYRRGAIGWKEDIQLTLRSDMENHFKRYYGPNNCQITIVGDVDAKTVFKMAKKYFGPWERVDIAHEITVTEPEQQGERRLEVEYDAEPQMLIGYHVPSTPHPDSYALEMTARILSTGKTSRFYMNIFVEKRLTGRSPYAWIGPGDRYPGLFTIGAASRAPHTLEEVEEAVFEELETLKKELVSDRDLERAKNRYKVWELMRMRSNQWLAYTLGGSFVTSGDWRTSIDDYERLMKVTSEDIKRVAEKYFTKTNRTVGYLVKPQAVAENEVETTEGDLEQ